MLRTIVWFLYFWIYLFFSIPSLVKVTSFHKAQHTKERDELVNETVQKWAKSLVKLTGSSISVKGLENVPKDKAVIFVANHQGNFDIPIFLGFIEKPKAFIAKKELKAFPIINQWMSYLNCIFMDRKDARQALKAINKGVEVLKEGYSLVIFPEGTRSNDGNLGEFKPGSLKLATKSGVPIVPVTIKGSLNIMPKNSIIIKPAQVEIIIDSLIDAETVKALGAKQLSENIRAIIEKNLNK